MIVLYGDGDATNKNPAVFFFNISDHCHGDISKDDQQAAEIAKLTNRGHHSHFKLQSHFFLLPSLISMSFDSLSLSVPSSSCIKRQFV